MVCRPKFAAGAGARKPLPTGRGGEDEVIEPGDPVEFVHYRRVADVQPLSGEQPSLGGGNVCRVGVCGQRQWLGHVIECARGAGTCV